MRLLIVHLRIRHALRSGGSVREQKLNRQKCRLNFWLEVLNNFITNHPDILVDLGRKTDLFYEHLELSDPLLFKKIESSKKNLC